LTLSCRQNLKRYFSNLFIARKGKGGKGGYLHVPEKGETTALKEEEKQDERKKGGSV